ncbi:peroxiredoxin family protein [Desulfosarcina sp. BuS5]|uniref:peroxiredoxin family protein n=1 Tax=Desulfosarcina sp. BuS5 TaxID=933262 RepID=UPI0006867F34|nr:redoxin domain-containing protein [Desulfosarcina sp. BuS5]
MGQMQQDYNKFIAKNASVVVITPHDAEKTLKYFSKNNLPFYGIPDPDHKIANLYKQQWKLTKLGLMPALFIINRAGKIVFSYYSKNMKDIPANDLIIGQLEN